MAEIKKLKDFSQLPDKQEFVGYIWLSDANKADWNNDPALISQQEKSNPFVMEGHWYSVDGQYSLAYKNSGEQAFYTLIDWQANGKDEALYEENFVANRLEGSEFLRFATIYQAEADPLCENYPVYQAKIVALRNIKRAKSN